METSKGPAFPSESAAADPYRSPMAHRGNVGVPTTVQLALRAVAALFAFIAMAVIASYTLDVSYSDGTFLFGSAKLKIGDFWFLSYMLVIDVLIIVYAIITAILFGTVLRKATVTKGIFIGIFALDLVFTCLLISSGTSAATGTRIVYSGSSLSTSKQYASAALTFLAFFVMAAATILSGIRAGRD